MNYVQSVGITIGYIFSYFSHVSFKIYLCTANWYLVSKFLVVYNQLYTLSCLPANATTIFCNSKSQKYSKPHAVKMGSGYETGKMYGSGYETGKMYGSGYETRKMYGSGYETGKIYGSGYETGKMYGVWV